MASGAIEPPIVSAATLGYHATGAIRIPIDGGVYWDVSDELRGVLRINRYGTAFYMDWQWRKHVTSIDPDVLCEWSVLVCSHRFTVGSIYWCCSVVVSAGVSTLVMIICSLHVPARHDTLAIHPLGCCRSTLTLFWTLSPLFIFNMQTLTSLVR